MANLRTAMDAAFWDLNLSTNRTIDGNARSIPGDPFPIEARKSSRALRIQQLSLLGNGFPLGLVPLFSPPSKKELGPLALQTVFLKAAISKWWIALVGQVRPKKLIYEVTKELNSIRKEITADEDWEWELSTFKNLPKCFLQKAFYSLGVCSQLALTDSSSLLLSMEKPGEEGQQQRMKAMYLHKLPDHDITLEAAWPERFMDHKERYWEVPESISLDCTSLITDGWRYRFGIHKNSGQPIAVGHTDDVVPPSLLPGVCAKAAVSYEHQKELWREKVKNEDYMVRKGKGIYYRPSYDLRLKEPHETISGIIGATCAAWFGGGNNSTRSPVSADLFGSVCYTLQRGNFRKLYKDLTRFDARLDVCSAAALAKKVTTTLFRRASNDRASDPRASPRLNLIFQQQVAGPIVFRLDTRLSIDTYYGIPGPKLEDYVISLNYALRVLHSGKVTAWYSPKRKEAMVEIRAFEF